MKQGNLNNLQSHRPLKLQMTNQRLIIRNMSCHCCLKCVKRLFAEHNIVVDDIGLGEATVTYDEEETDLEIISRLLESDGFELLMDKDKQLIDQIKRIMEIPMYL